MRNLTAKPCGWCPEKAISTRTVTDGTPGRWIAVQELKGVALKEERPEESRGYTSRVQENRHAEHAKIHIKAHRAGPGHNEHQGRWETPLGRPRPSTRSWSPTWHFFGTPRR